MNKNIPDYYKVLNESFFTEGSILVKSISKEDIQLIRVWRNNQLDILRQKKIINIQEQESYYKKYVWSEMNSLNPNQILLSIFKKNQLIGYGGLVNISWDNKRAEMSFILNDEIVKDETQYKQIFTEFITLLKNISFNKLNINKIYTETYGMRGFHISILEMNGFIKEGTLKSHVKINGNFVDSIMHGIIASSN